MGHVQDHPQILNLTHGFTAKICKPAVFAAPCAGSQRIFFVPGKACVSGAELVEFIDHINILADTLQALQTDEGVHFSVRLCLHHILIGTAYLHNIRTLRLFLGNSIHHLMSPFQRILVIRRIIPDDENTTLDISLFQPFIVVFTEDIVFAVQIVVSHIRPNVTVSIKIHKSVLLCKYKYRDGKTAPANNQVLGCT